jgi:hypothetical protein
MFKSLLHALGFIGIGFAVTDPCAVRKLHWYRARISRQVHVARKLSASEQRFDAAIQIAPGSIVAEITRSFVGERVAAFLETASGMPHAGPGRLQASQWSCRRGA